MKNSRELYETSIVIDTHADTFARVLDEGEDFFSPTSKLAVNYPDMVKGGLDVQVFALYIAPGLPPGKTIKRAMSMAGTFFQALEASNGKFVMARTVRDVRTAVASGRKCGLLAVEGGHIIEGDLNILRSLRNMGVVTMTLTHANTNEWADSSQDERRWGGLNDLGREVIREMNRLRMLIDVSHTSDETVEAVLELSETPVIASHSCCRAICDHPRNLTDDLIKKIASKGGLIDMAYYPPFVDDAASTAFQERWDQLRGANSPKVTPEEDPNYMMNLYARCMEGVPAVSIDKLCDHIDHAVSLVGAEHVGLGSDWDGATVVVKGLETCANLPLLNEALIKRGYKSKDLDLIMGENFLRVLERAVGE